MTTAAPGQVRALLSLRWSMIRDHRVRVGLLVLCIAAVSLAVLAVLAPAAAPLGRPLSSGVAVADLLQGPFDRTGEVRAILPAGLLVFAVLCIVAPATAGGGYEILPEAELVAYPVRVSTLVRMSLVLSPLNIAWYLQVLVLSMATAYAIRGPGGPVLPWAVLLAFLAVCTTAGQALGWLLVGVRRTRAGRWAAWLILASGVAAAVSIVRADRVTEIVDILPTRWIAGVQDRAGAADLLGWLPQTGALVGLAFLGYLATVRTATWALRRPGDLSSDGLLARPIARRDAPPGVYRTLVRTDRASVWRSPPLRRGLLVLAVLPVLAALMASLPWSSIVLLPPLVASGAALLFGVNALSLDGSGALWMASLPHDQSLVLRAKRRVTTEVVAGSVAIVLIGAALRASASPRLQDLLCAVGAAVGCVALVGSTCMRLSVTRPHRAELRGPRDTPAPPGSMAVYSVRLAATTTLIGLAYSVASFTSSWLLPVVMTVALVLVAEWRWVGTRRRWDDPRTRGIVVATVSSG